MASEANRKGLDIMVCEHCRYRHSWDCDDGLPYPPRGCDDFVLDFETLTKKQQKAIRRILAQEDGDE